jgi:hypothetical protein
MFDGKRAPSANNVASVIGAHAGVACADPAPTFHATTLPRSDTTSRWIA